MRRYGGTKWIARTASQPGKAWRHWQPFPHTLPISTVNHAPYWACFSWPVNRQDRRRSRGGAFESLGLLWIAFWRLARLILTSPAFCDPFKSVSWLIKCLAISPPRPPTVGTHSRHPYQRRLHGVGLGSLFFDLLEYSPFFEGQMQSPEASATASDSMRTEKLCSANLPHTHRHICGRLGSR